MLQPDDKKNKISVLLPDMLSTEVEIDSTGDEASMGDEVPDGGTSQKLLAIRSVYK